MMKRNALIAAAMVGSALMGGCVKQEYSQNATVNQDPLVVDQAMQRRDWDKSYAIYQNGSTDNWSTGFAYTTSGDVPTGLNYVTDTGIFFLNVATLPYTAYEQRNGQISSGVNVPETYTAAPQVPPRYQPTGDQVNAPAGGSTGTDNAASNNGQVVPINTVNNPDAQNNNTVNPTFPANPARTNNTAAGAVNDTTSGGANGAGGAAGSKAGSSGSSTGSGGAGAGGAAGGGK